jgi:hypothetical protein
MSPQQLLGYKALYRGDGAVVVKNDEFDHDDEHDDDDDDGLPKTRQVHGGHGCLLSVSCILCERVCFRAVPVDIGEIWGRAVVVNGKTLLHPKGHEEEDDGDE